MTKLFIRVIIVKKFIFVLPSADFILNRIESFEYVFRVFRQKIVGRHCLRFSQKNFLRAVRPIFGQNPKIDPNCSENVFSCYQVQISYNFELSDLSMFFVFFVKK